MSGPRFPVRLMIWNLCRGGRGTPAGDTLGQMCETVVDVAPDVLCCTETAGATDRIVAGCATAGLDGYRGHRLAADGTDDNLAIVTRLPVLAELRCPPGRTVDSYNFAGLRLGLPGGRSFSVFDTWLRFDVALAEALETTAAELAEGRARGRSDDELAMLELPQLANVEEILAEHLPAVVPDDTEPVILAGGFNTESHLDWPVELTVDRFGGALAPRWQVTDRLAKAGFVDAYRQVRPDPRADPGSTFNPLDDAQRLPHRIDYAFVGGAGATVSHARVLDERLPAHGPGPFYSDHGALVVDLHIG